MSITNGLCSIDDLKSALRITDDTDDTRLELAIDAATRLIEKVCDRRFWLTDSPSARVYIAETNWLVNVDDFETEEGLIVQTDFAGDGTFGTTWERADFQLEPLNALEYGNPWPYNKIRAIRSLYFPLWGGIAFPQARTQALVMVTAQWGWTQIPTDVQKACVIQAMSLFKADDVPFGATAFSETGIVRLRDALHPTAKLLLSDYTSDEVFVA